MNLVVRHGVAKNKVPVLCCITVYRRFYAALRMVILQIIVNVPTAEIGSLPYYFADVRT